MSNNVYLLKPELYDPRFNGWVYAEKAKSVLGLEEPTDDFKPDRAVFLDWAPKSLAKFWKPQPVKGTVAPFNDYPCLELTTPVFSKRAVDALGGMLTKNGELLRLDSPTGEYYAFNLLRKVDVLDSKKSDVAGLGPGERVLRINYHVFKPKLVEKETIFRIPQQPNLYFVTEQFKNRVESAALNGLSFIKVWPLPLGSDWQMLDKANRSKTKKVTLSGHALILRFRFENQSPSTREKKLLSKIEKSIRQQLKVETLDEPIWGTPEICETQDGEFQVFCSCPNCDELAVHLEEWCQSIEWENDFGIVKRYGNLYDKKAKEKRVSIRKAKR